MVSIHVLYDGYSYKKDNKMFANCTCTLIKGDKNIIVDCMTAWDKDKIIEGLAKHGLEPSAIDYAIATHGHSDHLGNLNLFLNATHIVGYTISKGNEFYDHSFDTGEEFIITKDIKVVPTPGHTNDDISVFVTLNSESIGSKLCVIAECRQRLCDPCQDSSCDLGRHIVQKISLRCLNNQIYNVISNVEV